MSRPQASSPPWAIASIIVSMGLVALGNGFLFAFIPVKLAAENFPPSVAGAMITGMAGGGVAACLVSGRLVQRVGHARVFSAFAAMLILAALALAYKTEPSLWISARTLYGFAITGLFIVSQSWLNDASANEWRGRVISIFYMTYVVSLGFGSFLLRFVSIEGNEGPIVSVFFAALAILPVGLTRLRTPPPPESVSLSLKKVWRISPVGLAGLFAVGGLTMMVQGFAPIYAASLDYSKDDIALLLFLMQFGMIAVQYPLGALSDRVDRRYVLIIACAIIIVSAGLATRINGGGLILMVLIFAVWSGSTETIFSVANAHANDRADPSDYVTLSSTLLVAWSLSAFLLPGLATVLTEFFGPKAFMFLAIAIASLYFGFVLLRLKSREATEEGFQEPFQALTAQAPYTPELSPHQDDA
ncbi:MAG: MFS transporter [Kiloniellales bacterium]|nr:MFS transporter [Kiloniellales bacterium]